MHNRMQYPKVKRKRMSVDPETTLKEDEEVTKMMKDKRRSG
jgi:hypothetical protein